MRFPWQPESEVRGNMAVGNLRETLLKVLANDQGVHVETLMAALGAVHGFASQNAALKRLYEAREQGETIPESAIALVKTVDEKRFIFGDWVNQSIFYTEENDLSLERIALGTAAAMGVELTDLVNPAELAGQIADTIGTPDFGQSLIIRDHHPHQTAVSLIKDLWQLVIDVMELEMPSDKQEPALDEAHWPAIVSVVVAQVLEMTKDVLDARLSVQLVMESAIMTAKVDPATVASSRWNVSEFDGGLLVNPKRYIASN